MSGGAPVAQNNAPDATEQPTLSGGAVTYVGGVRNHHDDESC